jgi:hypothetical protein
MPSPTLIIPEELMQPSQKKAVIAFLRDAPAER